MTPQAMAKTHAAAFVQSRPWTAQEFSGLLSKTGVFFVGDERCFALVRCIVDEAELLTIATCPRHQKKGLARQCMAEWMPLACKKGAKRAFLEVAADNAAAIGLYTSCGFAANGRRAGYYPRQNAPSVDAVIMSCALSKR